MASEKPYRNSKADRQAVMNYFTLQASAGIPIPASFKTFLTGENRMSEDKTTQTAAPAVEPLFVSHDYMDSDIPGVVVEVTHDVADEQGAFEDNAVSWEDALEASHGYEGEI